MPVRSQKREQVQAHLQGLPVGLDTYIRHVGQGLSIRSLARELGTHPSTVLRQVRRIEQRREDPLVDQALGTLERRAQESAQIIHLDPATDSEFRQQAVSTMLAMQGRSCVLAVVPGLEKAVVVRSLPEGGTQQLVVLASDIAERMALRGWIHASANSSRLLRYSLTSLGRTALKRLVAELENERAGLGEETSFGAQHRQIEERQINDSGKRRTVRHNAFESPVTLLGKARRAGERAFLTAEQVNAAERLREDFELARMGPRVTQDWGRFMTSGVSTGFNPNALLFGHEGAHARVAAALQFLGNGLGDIVLRMCCFLEGVEVAERSLGWPPRSARIVLKIALERLDTFYAGIPSRIG